MADTQDNEPIVKGQEAGSPSPPGGSGSPPTGEQHKEGAESGLMGKLRKLSRRLSGTFLESRGSLLAKPGKRPIYSYDGDTGDMIIGGVKAPELVAAYGTPLYVYDVNRIVDNLNDFQSACKQFKNYMLCYAVKANPALGIIDLLKTLGCGFDVTSGGELTRCLAAGVPPENIIYSGCGKSQKEIALAVEKEVGCINVESGGELERIEAAARALNKVQNVAIRVNPGTNISEDAQVQLGSQYSQTSHKFGVPLADAIDLFSRAKASSYLKIKGISCHLGSGIGSIDPYLDARDKMLALADELRNDNRIWVEHINLGGGFAAPGAVPQAGIADVTSWIEKLAKPITERGLKIILEPGRSLVADAGVLLTSVEYTKTVEIPRQGSNSRRSSINLARNEVVTSKEQQPKGIFGAGSGPIIRNYAIVDAGFNDFGKTALYGVPHRVIPAKERGQTEQGPEYKYDVVGPINESADQLARELTVTHKLDSGALLCIVDAGAYASSLSSNYSSRPRSAEVLVHTVAEGVPGSHYLIRERERWEDLIRHEKVASGLKLPSRDEAIEEGHEDGENGQ